MSRGCSGWGVEAHPPSLLSPGTGRSSFPNSWVATSRSPPPSRGDLLASDPTPSRICPPSLLLSRASDFRLDSSGRKSKEAGMGGTQKRRVGAPRRSSRGKDAPRGRRLHLRFLPGASLIYLAERRFLKPSAQGRRGKKKQILPLRGFGAWIQMRDVERRRTPPGAALRSNS